MGPFILFMIWLMLSNQKARYEWVIGPQSEHQFAKARSLGCLSMSVSFSHLLNGKDRKPYPSIYIYAQQFTCIGQRMTDSQKLG